MIVRYLLPGLGILALGLPPSLAGQVCNSAPVAVSDQTEAFLSPILIDVLANDVEPDGESMTPTLAGGTCGSGGGSVSLLLDLVLYTPPGMGLGAPCTIGYRVRDESGNTSITATVTVSNQTDPVFVDGFEAGDTSVWSETCQVTCGTVPDP